MIMLVIGKVKTFFFCFTDQHPQQQQTQMNFVGQPQHPQSAFNPMMANQTNQPGQPPAGTIMNTMKSLFKL